MLWRRKSKEEKVLEKMKEKKAQLDKLKEEISQMGKLILKDGKLQKVEDIPEKQQSITPDIPLPPIPPNENMVEAMKQELNQMRIQQMYKQPNQQPQMQQPQMQQPQMQQAQMQQAQMQQAQMQQAQMQQAQMEAQYRQEQMRRQQQMNQQQPQQFQQPQFRQMYQQPPPQMQLPPSIVSITLINGEVLQVHIPTEKLEDFIMQINTAIDNQSCLPLNNRIINGRNIITYVYE